MPFGRHTGLALTNSDCYRGNLMTHPAPETPPPNAALMQLLFGKQITYSLAAIARLGVADHMSKHFTPVDEIAGKVAAHPATLFRVIRMLSGAGVFEEAPGQRFALTPVGELLKSDAPGSLRTPPCSSAMSGPLAPISTLWTASAPAATA
jgi:hypothetical protein